MGRVLVKIGNLAILNIIYIFVSIFSLGLLLIPATSTLFHFIKKLRDDTYDPYDTIKPFFRKLFKNARKTINIQIVFIALIFFCSFNIINSGKMTYPIYIKNVLLIFYSITIIECLLVGLMVSYLNANYIFKKESDILKMSFYLVHRHLLTSLTVFVALVLISFVLYTYSILIALIGVFSFFMYGLELLYNPVTQKYQIKKDDNND